MEGYLWQTNNVVALAEFFHLLHLVIQHQANKITIAIQQKELKNVANRFTFSQTTCVCESKQI